MLCTLNVPRAICQLYLNRTKKIKKILFKKTKLHKEYYPILLQKLYTHTLTFCMLIAVITGR